MQKYLPRSQGYLKVSSAQLVGGRIDSEDSLYLRCLRMIEVSEYTSFEDWIFCHLDEN